MNKDKKIYLILIVIILILIAGLYYYKSVSSEKLTNELAKCISSKSIMYSKEGCIHCENQKKILGEYLDKFIIIDCSKENEKCIEAQIRGTPTWKINNKTFEGVQTIKNLKIESGC